jgi:DNA-binding transcriptional LysR family regulator
VVKSAQRPDAEMERPSPRSRLDRLSWDDLRVFLSCASGGSLREAAKSLGLSSSTVCRRIDRLEYLLDVELFHRLPDGVMLTPDGQQIAQSVRQMHDALCNFERKRSDQVESSRGEVTIAVTEGLGSYWVMPQLVEFQRDNPRTIVNLYCAMESVDVLRLEADFAIQFIKPTSLELITAKLGKLHIYPFASQGYLQTYGTPRNVQDMVNHRLVEQVAPQLNTSALARIWAFHRRRISSASEPTPVLHIFTQSKKGLELAGCQPTPWLSAPLSCQSIWGLASLWIFG